MDDYPPRDDDDHDELAALAFYAPEQTDAPEQSDASGLDALEEYAPTYDGGVADDAAEDDYFGPADEAAPSADQPAVPLFTVTNPPGTVTVTTFTDGRVHEIDLSPKVTTLTETQLAEEIVVIARLATQDARAAQFSFMLEGMNQQGHDEVATRDFLNRDLDLPSPEQATATRAEVFAHRYASDHE
ncbi:MULTISPECIES: YbaB/EbfC family DNA-binding protein [unclassified Mycobacterium]|uniref:YbaB/EbfC family DNA-binding protein n=1 Tax=unclassified Mycobacterium TaxID=2642494 RepID=UPI0029C68324|nr:MULTISPECIES: YbaB/EbfC family DNA-binding protein [unclassified Mycobacterium]